MPDGISTQLHYALRHFNGIGPARLQYLRELGISTWQQLVHADDALLSQAIPISIIQSVKEQAQANLDAARQGDLAFFVAELDIADRWRLLHDYWEQCVFLDIETSSFEWDADITVIATWDGRQPRLFVNGDNLDDFPDYLLESPLLVTFNGSAFDLPVIKRVFSLPEDLPTPHVDLRWICRRCDLTGGLKPIEHNLGIQRPDDLQGTNGGDAVNLWHRWTKYRNADARTHLLRYCAADTIALRHVAAKVLAQSSGNPERFALNPQQDWDILEQTCPAPERRQLRTRPYDPSNTQPPLPRELMKRLHAFLSRKSR